MVPNCRDSPLYLKSLYILHIFELSLNVSIVQVWVQFTRPSQNEELQLQKEKCVANEENSSGMPVPRTHSFKGFISAYYLLICLNCPNIYA